MATDLPGFGRADAATALQRIANWWLENAIDEVNGGFHGEIDAGGKPVAGAPKGIILNSRILWFFSEMLLHDGGERYRRAANRAYDTLIECFDDTEFGGAAWEVSAQGDVTNDRKQVYAQCFCVYAFCAYFRASGDEAALAKAADYVELIESYARDPVHGGYIEAFARDWQPISDLRLSEQELNVPKTMNTHLHLLEAYTAMHLTEPTDTSRRRLGEAIEVLVEKILAPDHRHLRLFFDREWQSRSDIVSYGHDIETSWLLYEAATVHGGIDVSKSVIGLADSCLKEGIGPGGRVCNEYDPVSGHRDERSVWWVQAEALVGFLNAAERTGSPRFRRAADAVWQFVRREHIDDDGEWSWFAGRDAPAAMPYKAGFWKAPYHNGRALLEALRRLPA